MAPGFLTLFEPGTSVTVTLLADSNSNVATTNDLVEPVGENSSHTEVSAVENAGMGAAVMETLPRDYDPNGDYAAGEEIGEATVLLRHAVDWLLPNSGGWDQTAADPATTSASAGDLAYSAVGGSVQLYDAANDDPIGVVGPVWTTLSRGAQTAEKVAVVRQR